MKLLLVFISFVVSKLWPILLGMAINLFSWTVHAEILPSTSAVIIAKGKKESSIDIKNQGDTAVLLYSKITKLDDDNLAGGVLYTVPQVILVQPGASQTVRVIYRSNTPLDKEHIARVVFTGIPPKDGDQAGKVKIIIGQDLPVVIGANPSIGQQDMWQKIHYQYVNNKICMTNPTLKVFRFDANMVTEQPKTAVTFNKNYLLPNESLCSAPLAQKLGNKIRLSLSSISNYNYRIKTNTVTFNNTL